VARWLAIGVVAGAWAWPYCPAGLVASATAAAVLAGLAMAAGQARPMALVAAGFCCGLGLVARIEAGPELRGEYSARGWVVGAAEGRVADVDVASVSALGGAPVNASGRLRVVFPGPPPPPGVAVVVAGTARRIDPTRLPGDVDPAVVAARDGVRSVLVADSVVRLGRDREAPDFEGARHAALLRALVDGTVGEIPAEEAQLLRRTGTWHLVSVSGLHVGVGAAIGWWVAWVMSRPFLFLSGGLARWTCAVGGIAGAWLYADIADWGVPARRAAWMASAACVALAARRRPDPQRTLALAALAVVASEPEAVGSVGFALSFGAMLGMILVSGRASRLLPPDLPRWLRWTLEGLAASLGATAGTLPVVALHFQSLSPASPLANLWAVPWIGSLATPLALVAAVTKGEVHDLALALADAAATAGLWGLRGVDMEPWAPAVGVAGAAVLGLAGLLWRREILALGLTLAILAPWPRSRRELVVSFLAVGQGDAALVEWPDGRRWLVDGGPPGQDLLRYLRRRGIRRLDSVFVSHGHPDHYGGLLPVLDALDVGEVVARGLVSDLAGAAPLWTSSHPSILPLPRDFEARDENDRSLVLRLGLGAHTFLLPGDAEWAEEQALVAANCAGLQATVLKVGHHGSRTSSSAPFLACARPEHAVISAGFDNRYRHPHPGVLKSLATAAFAPRTWRTDQQGTIEFRTDGERLAVRTLATPTGWRLRGR